jgi:hypothetical protein
MTHCYTRHIAVLFAASLGIVACENRTPSTNETLVSATPGLSADSNSSQKAAETLFNEASMPEDGSISPSGEGNSCCGLLCVEPSGKVSFFKFFGAEGNDYERPVRKIASAFDDKSYLEAVTCTPDPESDSWDCKDGESVHKQVRQKGNQFIIKNLKRHGAPVHYQVCAYTNSNK